jgi:hypothetical protein
VPAFANVAGADSAGCGIWLALFSCFGDSAASIDRCDGTGVGASFSALISLSFSASISTSRASISSWNFAYRSSSSRMPLIVSSLNCEYSTSNIAPSPTKYTRRGQRAVWKSRCENERCTRTHSFNCGASTDAFRKRLLAPSALN